MKPILSDTDISVSFINFCKKREQNKQNTKNTLLSKMMLNVLNIRLIAGRSRSLVDQLLKRQIVHRYFHEEFKNTAPTPAESKAKPHPSPLAVSSKYQMFKNEDSPVILDMAEERLKIEQETETNGQPTDMYAGLNLNSKYSTPCRLWFQKYKNCFFCRRSNGSLWNWRFGRSAAPRQCRKHICVLCTEKI